MSGKNVSKSKKAEKKPNFFVRIGRWFKEKFKGMWSELKKVTWPSFGKVVKNTGIVLVVVLIFGVVIAGIDVGLQALLNLLKQVKAEDVEKAASALLKLK